MTADDRARIAAEIHDGPVQELTVARLRLEVLRQRLAGDEAALRDLAALEGTLAEASERLHEIVVRLQER